MTKKNEVKAPIDASKVDNKPKLKKTSGINPRDIKKDQTVTCVKIEKNACEDVCYSKLLFGLVPSVIWPITIVILIILFKEKIQTIIDTLIGLLGDTGTFEYKDAKWIRKTMNQVNEKANIQEAIPEVTGDYYIDKANEQVRYRSFSSLKADDFLDDKKTKLDVDKIYELAISHPRSAILEAWSVLDQFGQTYVQKKKLSIKRVSPFMNLRLLKENDVFDDRQFSILNEMRQIRNKVAHSQAEVDSSTANEYVTTVLRLAVIISKNFYS